MRALRRHGRGQCRSLDESPPGFAPGTFAGQLPRDGMVPSASSGQLVGRQPPMLPLQAIVDRHIFQRAG
jgi:hypothetical protein